MTRPEIETALRPYVIAYVNYRCSDRLPNGETYATNTKDAWNYLYDVTMTFLTLVISARPEHKRKDKLESVKRVHLMVDRIYQINDKQITRD